VQKVSWHTYISILIKNLDSKSEQLKIQDLKLKNHQRYKWYWYKVFFLVSIIETTKLHREQKQYIKTNKYQKNKIKKNIKIL